MFQFDYLNETVNKHDTAFRWGRGWHVARGSAKEAFNAQRRNVCLRLLALILAGAILGVGVVFFARDAPTLGNFFFAAILGSLALTFFIFAVSNDSILTYVRGAIPEAQLSDQAAPRLTPEMRGRLITAAEEGLLSRALDIVEQDAAQEAEKGQRKKDRQERAAQQRAEGIMHPAAPTTQRRQR